MVYSGFGKNLDLSLVWLSDLMWFVTHLMWMELSFVSCIVKIPEIVSENPATKQ